MHLRYAAAALLAVSASPALADCRECTTTAGHKASSVKPDDNGNLNRFGDLFSNEATRLELQGNRTTTVDLGFTATIGKTSFNQVSVNENGIIAFQAARQVASAEAQATSDGGIQFHPVESLKEFDGPVIAAFYADLQQGQVSSRTFPEVGQIYVQYGYADPTPNAKGMYSLKDAVKATRITWYGLPVGQTVDSAAGELYASSDSNLAWAQLLITDMGNGDFNFEFRSGDPDQDGPPFSQPGLGSLAGFNLNGDVHEWRGPYDDGTPSYFAFRNGVLATGGVPEPANWLMMIGGFGAVGAFARAKRRRITVTYA